MSTMSNVLHNRVYIGSNAYEGTRWSPGWIRMCIAGLLTLAESVSSERHDEHERKGFA
jgi:hypothetical protein